MNRSLLPVLLLICGSSYSFCQSSKIYGKITNTKLEPLAFVSVQVKDYQQGTITKDDGTYELLVDNGKYDIVISMIGYQSKVITVIVDQKSYMQNIILEADNSTNLAEVIVRGKIKDRSEEIIRNVIRNKEKLQSAPGAYSCMVYIKATQEDSSTRRKKKKDNADTILNANADLLKMAMAEISLRYDHETDLRTKEERIGIAKRGNTDGLFYLTTTEGNFDFYNNLVKVPSVSQTPFLSPVSYSGLLGYKFKMLKIEDRNGRKFYTISVKPRQLSNATVEGVITVMDSAWAIIHTRFSLPEYHLPQYDFFEVEQNYDRINDSIWMITRQHFTYFSKSGKAKKSGQTIVSYKDFELNKQFPKKYFGTEISKATEEAYEKDSSF
ncbi:MAG: carboxypeptidase-like regulatory domain-containing protein, partial [Chitinophagaceae bacterium]|nr:carboxypeptidase-like regulatory domain-containing protein [Chitinophagaceae bacterium]